MLKLTNPQRSHQKQTKPPPLQPLSSPGPLECLAAFSCLSHSWGGWGREKQLCTPKENPPIRHEQTKQVPMFLETSSLPCPWLTSPPSPCTQGHSSQHPFPGPLPRPLLHAGTLWGEQACRGPRAPALSSGSTSFRMGRREDAGEDHLTRKSYPNDLPESCKPGGWTGVGVGVGVSAPAGAPGRHRPPWLGSGCSLALDGCCGQ